VNSASDTRPVLVTEDLSRSFGGLAAVRNVSIELNQGELHAVIGPNGAGKTTLVNLLSGDLRPTSGRILLDSRDIAAAPVWHTTAAGIGRSFQRTNIFPSLSVIDNVLLAARSRRQKWRSLWRRSDADQDAATSARSAIERAGLDAPHRRAAGLLSHGQQRQLEIAMVLATDPRVLLLDEPLAGMGPEESERIAALLLSLAREHAVLLIEHDMDFVFQVADRMTVMVEGQVLASGEPAAIRANADVQRAYLGGH
jgi:branched-chain amino acid transport system ATP-binding protein